MDLGAAVVADEEPLVFVEPGEGALDDPADLAQARAVRGFAAGDLRDDPAVAQLATVTVGVVAAVGGDPIGSPARPPSSPTYSGDPVDHRQQLGDVVAVSARERPGKRDPRRVD